MAYKKLKSGGSYDTGYARRFGDTVASGGMDVTVNGETVKAQGNDIGNMANVTRGIANLKNRRADASLNEENGNVMLGGTDTGIPAKDFADGVDDDAMERLRTGYTSASGDSVLRARQAAESSGLGNLVKWDSKTNKMSIAGVDVPYLYITGDGNAMVSEKTLNDVLEKVKQTYGIQTANETAQSVYDKYDKQITDAVEEALKNEFQNYDPTEDPSYEAYAKEYERLAEQAYNRAMGSGGLYGSPSSYNVYQAIAGYADNMQKMSDMIPQLEENAYERYSDNADRAVDTLNALLDARESEYEMRNSANESQLDRMADAEQNSYDRHEDSVYNYPMNEEKLKEARLENDILEDDTVKSAIETDMYEAMQDIDYRIKNAELTQSQVDTMIKRVQLAQERAILYNGGMFMKQDMDALGISQDMDRYPDTNGYPEPWDAQINAKLAEWREYTLLTGVY